MNRCILSLDQSLRVTGYAVFKNDELLAYGTFSVDESLPIEKRLHTLMKNVQNLCKQYSPDVICFEDIQDQHNISTFKKLAFVQAAILIYCSIINMRYEVMAPSHWRKVLGGGFGKKREEQKQHAIELVKNTYNIDVDSDTADAICIGMAYIKENQ